MPDWSDPVEILKDASAFQKLNLALLGLSTWEIINQLPFDWSVISRKREAHWPLFVYFYCKYSLWLAVIGVNVALNVTTEVNCQSLYVWNQFAGNTAIGSASTLLMLRTIAVWNRNPLVTIPLIITSLGQWGILFHGIATVKSSWDPVASACVVNAVPPVFVELIYLYTMSFDLIVLVLTTVGLVLSPGRSSLWQLLFRQGIVYFFVAFVSNLIAATFLLLNLNPIMNIMFAIPAATATSIVACRSFVYLTTFRTKDLYVHSAQPFSATRVGSGNANGGDGHGGPDVIHGRPGGPSSVGKKGGFGGTIAGLAFRGMGAGIDSMGETHAYSMNELDTTTSTLNAANGGHHYISSDDKKYGGEIDEAGYTSKVVHMPNGGNGRGGVLVQTRSEHSADIDLERAESLNGGHQQKSFVPAL